MSLDETERLRAQISALEADKIRLEASLRHSQNHVFYLLRWVQQLQRNIDDVYNSVTWRIGKRIVKIILTLLRRPEGTTAQDHIQRINHSINIWCTQYWREHKQLLPYTPWHHQSEYHSWFQHHSHHNAVQCAQIQHYTPQIKTTFSLILSVSSVPQTSLLTQTLHSVITQLYPYWQLICVIDTDLELDCPRDPRLKIVTCTPQSSATQRFNHALSHANGDFIGFIDAHDCLAKEALFYIAHTLENNPHALLIYTDEDRIDAEGQHDDPYFKPDWSPDLFYAQAYLHRLCLYRRQIVIDAAGFPNCTDTQAGAEEYALLLSLLSHAKAHTIIHLPRVLYHAHHSTERLHGSAWRAVLQAHFHAQAQTIKISAAPGDHARLSYKIPTPAPLVSVIIPTRDRLELLRTTVEGVLHYSAYPTLEIIIVDNGSRDRATLAYLTHLSQHHCVTVLHHDAPFNYSQLNNLAVQHAQGTVLALLNNDLRIIHPDWLTEMVGHAMRPEIGAVGAKLYYTHDNIQHAGVITGLGGLAGHPFKHIPRLAPGYQWRLCLSHNVAAVTGACMVLRREVFIQAKGFDEHLRIAFNDVDLCLRIRQCGYRILWTPYAELYHLESASRGMDDTAAKYLQLQREITYMRQRWGEFLAYDPYYNVNLTLEYEDYALAKPPSA
jgi:O-antigen biosynthesis protein